MSWLSRIADRLIMAPSTQPIDPEGREQRLIDSPDGEIEVWINRKQSSHPNPRPVTLLKFPGAGGRAERGGPHPAELWPEIEAEIWTVNHRGYGGTPGIASMQNLAATCDRVWTAATLDRPGNPIVTVGNSLGCLSALYLSARYQVSGVYVRNPPALAQMIATRKRYTWWSFGFSKRIADQIPAELDAAANAGRSNCPALFVQSERDRVIPGPYQELVWQNYAGAKRRFINQGADHHHPISEPQRESYIAEVQWLGSQVT